MNVHRTNLLAARAPDQALKRGIPEPGRKFSCVFAVICHAELGSNAKSLQGNCSCGATIQAGGTFLTIRRDLMVLEGVCFRREIGIKSSKLKIASHPRNVGDVVAAVKGQPASNGEQFAGKAGEHCPVTETRQKHIDLPFHLLQSFSIKGIGNRYKQAVLPPLPVKNCLVGRTGGSHDNQGTRTLKIRGRFKDKTPDIIPIKGLRKNSFPAPFLNLCL